MGSGRTVSRKEAAKRLTMYEQGYEIAEIAKRCGIATASMKQWFKKYGNLAGERKVRG